MKKKTVFVIQGYESATPEGRLTDVITFEVYATTEMEAMDRIKNFTINPKKFYRVDRVIETYK